MSPLRKAYDTLKQAEWNLEWASSNRKEQFNVRLDEAWEQYEEELKRLLDSSSKA